MSESFAHNIGGYTNHGCRCAQCVEAWRVYHSDLRTRRAARGVPAGIHGSASTYNNYRCRCDLCVAAKRASRQKVTA